MKMVEIVGYVYVKVTDLHMDCELTKYLKVF